MNREIKFRVFDRMSKRMHIVGTDHHDSMRISWSGDNQVCYYNLQNGEGSILSGEEMPADDSGYILMQYTGLKDKNGKEIYEGDIVNCKEYECYGKITWDEDCAAFYFEILQEDGTFIDEWLYDYIDELEVIGNIYENPELLEVEE